MVRRYAKSFFWNSWNRVVGKARKVGPANSVRSRRWITVFHFCKVPHPLLEKLKITRQTRHYTFTGVQRGQKWRKIDQNELPLKDPLTHQWSFSVRLVEFPGILGCWEVDYTPRAVDQSTPVSWDFLRVPIWWMDCCSSSLLPLSDGSRKIFTW